MKPQIGGSWLCGFPLSQRQTVDCFINAGLNCCQASVSRWFGRNPRLMIRRLNYCLPIVSFEGAWRETTLGAWRLRKTNPAAPRWRDFMIFPGPIEENRQLEIFRSVPDAWEIVHNLDEVGDRRLLEIHSGLFMPWEQIAKPCPQRLRFDRM